LIAGSGESPHPDDSFNSSRKVENARLGWSIMKSAEVAQVITQILQWFIEYYEFCWKQQMGNEMSI